MANRVNFSSVNWFPVQAFWSERQIGWGEERRQETVRWATVRMIQPVVYDPKTQP
jgi:hypothetical protein